MTPLRSGYKVVYGFYLRGLDRVAERSTMYGLLRETPSFGPKEQKRQPHFAARVAIL